MLELPRLSRPCSLPHLLARLQALAKPYLLEEAPLTPLVCPGLWVFRAGVSQGPSFIEKEGGWHGALTARAEGALVLARGHAGGKSGPYSGSQGLHL